MRHQYFQKDQREDQRFSVRSARRSAFTLVELIIVIAIISVLAAGLIIGLNPAAQLAKGRNTQRESHLNSIMNAIGQRITDNDGDFNCSSGDLPTSTKRMAHASSTPSSTYDIAPCLVPNYLAELYFDPRPPTSASSTHYSSSTDYNSGYDIMINETTKRRTLTAPYAELDQEISITR